MGLSLTYRPVCMLLRMSITIVIHLTFGLLTFFEFRSLSPRLYEKLEKRPFAWDPLGVSDSGLAQGPDLAAHPRFRYEKSPPGPPRYRVPRRW